MGLKVEESKTFGAIIVSNVNSMCDQLARSLSVD